MTRSELEAALAALVDAEAVSGIRWWPGSEMPPVALRRWASFARRHKDKQLADGARVNDLAKGLQAHFEPKTPFTHFNEFLHLAGKMAAVLGSRESDL